jgi:hypothetical protein
MEAIMDRSIGRVGAWAGVAALVGIFGYHLALMAIAGQRASGTTDAVAINAYYQHAGIAALSVEQFVTLIPMLVFVVALREQLSTAPWTRFLTTIALVAVTAEIAVLLSEVALQAALVATARSGGDAVGLFRFWDVLYNSGAYALEAVWVSAFGLAMRGVAGFPGWLPRFSFVTAALLAINITAIWVGIPDIATLPSAVFLGIWFGATSLGLHRAAAMPAPAMSPAAG